LLKAFAAAYARLLFVEARRISLRTVLKDESGVTAIEYTLIAALIAVAAVASFILIGTDISATFSTVGAKL
jgi:pilus assembly protein Flp/PilA